MIKKTLKTMEHIRKFYLQTFSCLSILFVRKLIKTSKFITKSSASPGKFPHNYLIFFANTFVLVYYFICIISFIIRFGLDCININLIGNSLHHTATRQEKKENEKYFVSRKVKNISWHIIHAGMLGSLVLVSPAPRHHCTLPTNIIY